MPDKAKRKKGVSSIDDECGIDAGRDKPLRAELAKMRVMNDGFDGYIRDLCKYAKTIKSNEAVYLGIIVGREIEQNQRKGMSDPEMPKELKALLENTGGSVIKVEGDSEMGDKLAKILGQGISDKKKKASESSMYR